MGVERNVTRSFSISRWVGYVLLGEGTLLGLAQALALRGTPGAGSS